MNPFCSRYTRSFLPEIIENHLNPLVTGRIIDTVAIYADIGKSFDLIYRDRDGNKFSSFGDFGKKFKPILDSFQMPPPTAPASSSKRRLTPFDAKRWNGSEYVV